MRLYRFDQAVGRRVTLHGSRFTQAAFWEPGEEHEAGTGTGPTAVVLEGDDVSVWAAPGGPGT